MTYEPTPFPCSHCRRLLYKIVHVSRDGERRIETAEVRCLYCNHTQHLSTVEKTFTKAEKERFKRENLAEQLKEKYDWQPKTPAYHLIWREKR